jgi:hypothetical protein
MVDRTTAEQNYPCWGPTVHLTQFDVPDRGRGTMISKSALVTEANAKFKRLLT